MKQLTLELFMHLADGWDISAKPKDVTLDLSNNALQDLDKQLAGAGVELKYTDDSNGGLPYIRVQGYKVTLKEKV